MIKECKRNIQNRKKNGQNKHTKKKCGETVNYVNYITLKIPVAIYILTAREHLTNGLRENIGMEENEMQTTFLC